MKKRRIKWSYGNPDFAAFEVEAAAGSLVARRNHPLVRTGERLCQGWDLWLGGKFAGALSSRTLTDLATLARAELLRVLRAAGVIMNSSLSNRACPFASGVVSGRMPDGVRRTASSGSNSV